MGVEESGSRSPAAQTRSWSILLPKPAQRSPALRPEAMSASELMFFFGAPLAHVVDYEQHERASRQEKAVRVLARSRRAPDFGASAEPAALLSSA